MQSVLGPAARRPGGGEADDRGIAALLATTGLVIPDAHQDIGSFLRVITIATVIPFTVINPAMPRAAFKTL